MGANEEGNKRRQVGQINQQSGNKMGGVKTINMRAHGQQNKITSQVQNRTRTRS